MDFGCFDCGFGCLFGLVDCVGFYLTNSVVICYSMSLWLVCLVYSLVFYLLWLFYLVYIFVGCLVLVACVYLDLG